MTRDNYRQRIVSADDAVSCVQSNQRVYCHNGCAEPLTLIEALVHRAPSLRNVEVLHAVTFGPAPYTAARYAGIFRHNSLFIGGNVRAAVQEGRADYTPIFLSDVEAMFEGGCLRPDVALIGCSPPDADGYMSVGPSVDVSLTAAEEARHLIVEINDRMPRVSGDTRLHVDRVAAFVETSRTLLEYQAPSVDAVDARIAEHVVGLVPDRATVQAGIGSVPRAVLQRLRTHRDLGLHSELLTDDFVDLIEAGAVTNRFKGINEGVSIAGFLLGSARLFDFVDRNSAVELRRTRYVNDPVVIAANHRLVAINSAIEVDLTGQVCADSFGPRMHSGIGGQVDFLRGAARSRGGVPIIVMPSTARAGTTSRIVARLQPGAGVVTSRGDVHYVATEFGVVNLHGKTLRQRAEALIAIAHPAFQPDLVREVGPLLAGCLTAPSLS
jgi:4-hydroxybutyrate CoA-transferase